MRGREKVPFQWVRSGRKTVALQVKEDGTVTVRTPWGFSRSQAEELVERKAEWIKRQRSRLKELRDKRPSLTEEQRRAGWALARQVIPERVAWYAGKMGVSYGRITLREQKTRWGSCSSAGNLNFNWMLALMPRELLDYVVVHELAHRREMNHSERFWELVEKILPDYRERRKRLREESWR